MAKLCTTVFLMCAIAGVVVGLYGVAMIALACAACSHYMFRRLDRVEAEYNIAKQKQRPESGK